MTTKLLVNRERWQHSGVSFLLMDEWEGKRWIPAPLEMVPQANEAVIESPTFRLREAEAQALMDMLWDCGLRPSEGSGSAGALAATQRHLDDMRRLVFGKMEGEPA